MDWLIFDHALVKLLIFYWKETEQEMEMGYWLWGSWFLKSAGILFLWNRNDAWQPCMYDEYSFELTQLASNTKGCTCLSSFSSWSLSAYAWAGLGGSMRFATIRLYLALFKASWQMCRSDFSRCNFMQTRAEVNLVKNCYAFTRGNNVSDCF